MEATLTAEPAAAPNCVRWSADNFIAVATEGVVTILVRTRALQGRDARTLAAAAASSRHFVVVNREFEGARAAAAKGAAAAR